MQVLHSNPFIVFIEWSISGIILRLRIIYGPLKTCFVEMKRVEKSSEHTRSNACLSKQSSTALFFKFQLLTNGNEGLANANAVAPFHFQNDGERIKIKHVILMAVMLLSSL